MPFLIVQVLVVRDLTRLSVVLLQLPQRGAHRQRVSRGGGSLLSDASTSRSFGFDSTQTFFYPPCSVSRSAYYPLEIHLVHEAVDKANDLAVFGVFLVRATSPGLTQKAALRS